MSEISLRDYFAKLETLLNASAADEVIHHCRHILSYYPKNVTAYRFLGRALLLNGRWDEAAAALRRVLSVVPDDYHAHHGLSEVFDHRRKPEDAIWHMERAYEQQPNNRELLESLRSLYRRYRNIDQAKIQLTAAAVARQAIRNHAYDQALDTLRDALERQPERVDLQLLLARALWENGSHVEGAEIALDVLQTLPDCLEANRMLTTLWLEEERPSDAQRYLSRVEAIDPYLAVEVAQGLPASDDAFRLEEFNYARSLQSELISGNQDWLEGITAAPQSGGAPDADDWSGFMSSMLSGSNAAKTDDQPVTSGDLFAEDWMELPTEVSEANPMDEDEIPLEFAALPPPDLFAAAADEAPPAETEDSLSWLEQASPDLFADAAEAPPVEVEDSLRWLEGASSDLFAEPVEEAQPTEVEDSLSWLEQASPDLFADAAEEVPSVDEEDVIPNIEVPDAMAWLQADYLNDEAQTPRQQPEPDVPAWMQNHDVQIIDEPPLLESAASPVEVTASDDDAAAFWQDDHDALEEALSLDQLASEDEPPPDWLSETVADDATDERAFSEAPTLMSFHLLGTAPLPALSEPDNEPETEDSAWLADVSQQDAQAVPGPRRGLTAMLDEANFDWKKTEETQEDIMSDAVMDEWLAQFGAESQPAAPENPDWLNELDTAMNDKNNLPNSSDETPDWLSAAGGEGEPEDAFSEEELDWLNSDESDAEAEPEPAEMPDWMAELQPDEMAASSTDETAAEPEAAEEFEWSDSEADAEAVPAEIPDWLTSLEPTSTYETPSSASLEDDSERFAAEEASASAAQSDMDAWLDQSAIEAESLVEEAAEPPAAEAAAPDWLTELNLPETQPATEAEPAGTPPESAEWFDEQEIEAEYVEGAAEPTASSDTPSWLTELQIENEPLAQAEAESAADDDASWLDELAIEAEAQVEDAVEPIAAVSADVPEWLSELQGEQPPEAAGQPDDEPVAAAEDQVDWLDEIEVEQVAEDAGQAVAAEAHDWLAETPPVEAEPSSEAEPAADIPAWLADLEPVQSDQVDAVEPVDELPLAEQDEDYAWLDEVAPESETMSAAETVATDEGFDWLGSLNPEMIEPEGETPEAEPVMATEADILPPDDEALIEEFEVEPDLAPSLALADDDIDEDEYWLNEQEQEQEDLVSQPLDEDDVLESEPEFLHGLPADELDEEGFEPAPAGNAPDWLNAMVPGLDVDYEAAEDEPIETEFVSETPEEAEEEREFAWVEDIVEEESRQLEPVVLDEPRGRFSFSRPPAWLSRLGRSSKPAKRDDELPDWPTDEPDWQR